MGVARQVCNLLAAVKLQVLLLLLVVVLQVVILQVFPVLLLLLVMLLRLWLIVVTRKGSGAGLIFRLVHRDLDRLMEPRLAWWDLLIRIRWVALQLLRLLLLIRVGH